jgi:SSS family solute:Na+ symporter
MDGVKPVHTLAIGDGHYTVYTGLLALLFNVAVAAIIQLLMKPATRAPAGT